MKNKLRIKKMDQARERASGRQPIGWTREESGGKIGYVPVVYHGIKRYTKINLSRSLNPEE